MANFSDDLPSSVLDPEYFRAWWMESEEFTIPYDRTDGLYEVIAAPHEVTAAPHDIETALHQITATPHEGLNAGTHCVLASPTLARADRVDKISRRLEQKRDSQNRLRRRHSWLKSNGVQAGILQPGEKIPKTAMEVRAALLKAQQRPGDIVPDHLKIQPDELRKAPAGKGTGRKPSTQRPS